MQLGEGGPLCSLERGFNSGSAEEYDLYCQHMPLQVKTGWTKE